MNIVWFFILGLSSIQIASAFDGRLLKHFTQPRSGGILDILKPKLPAVNVHVSKRIGGFGTGAAIGSFGFGFSFGGQHVPPGSGQTLPPKGYPIPDEESYVPGLNPDLKPHIPDTSNPDYPDLSPHVPNRKPYVPGAKWEREKGQKERPRPSWDEYEADGPKRGSYGESEIGHPRPDPYEESKEDTRPAWEDIGEAEHDDRDSKSESFMDGELVNEGLINPRVNKRRTRRFIESHVYHVPLLFRSNAKPFQVKFQRNPNSLLKEK